MPSPMRHPPAPSAQHPGGSAPGAQGGRRQEAGHGGQPQVRMQVGGCVCDMLGGGGGSQYGAALVACSGAAAACPAPAAAARKSPRWRTPHLCCRPCAPCRKKLEWRLGAEKNAKGHRVKVNKDFVGYFESARLQGARLAGLGQGAAWAGLGSRRRVAPGLGLGRAARAACGATPAVAGMARSTRTLASPLWLRACCP